MKTYITFAFALAAAACTGDEPQGPPQPWSVRTIQAGMTEISGKALNDYGELATIVCDDGEVLSVTLRFDGSRGRTPASNSQIIITDPDHSNAYQYPAQFTGDELTWYIAPASEPTMRSAAAQLLSGREMKVIPDTNMGGARRAHFRAVEFHQSAETLDKSEALATCGPLDIPDVQAR